MLNLINYQPGIDKIYLYTKYPYEAKDQFLNKKRESAGLKHCNDHKVFIEYSSNMNEISKYIDECNPGKKRKILKSCIDCLLIVYMIVDMISNKKLNPIVTELFV